MTQLNMLAKYDMSVIGLLYFFYRYCQLLFLLTGSVFSLLWWLSLGIGLAEQFSIMVDLQWYCSVQGYIEG